MQPSSAPIHPKYRPDIDGLRAVAVLLVVAFHAFPYKAHGGFIGVDIFFVISGFLISTIIYENLERGTFSFADFYRRRVRRIFPALALVLLATLGAGWVLLFDDEFRRLAKHIAAGAGFVSNLALWGESGYFDSAAETKPLLHLWSLGVEEQFYLAWPPLVILAARCRIGIPLLLAGVALASFAYGIVIGRTDVVGMFYSPLSRFWQLLVGASLAWMTLRCSELIAYRPATANFVSLFGITLLVVACVELSPSSFFPAWWALLPTFGAALLIAAGPQAVVNRHLLRQPLMVWFGLISYPLYLWHWPVLSYLALVLGEPSRLVRALAVVCAVLLAWMTYRFLELPIRKSPTRRYVPSLVAAVTVLLSVGLFAWIAVQVSTNLGRDPVVEVRDLEADLGCEQALGLQRVADEQCATTTATPTELFIGDSHAWALSKAAIFTGKQPGATTIAAWACPPFPGLSYEKLDSSSLGRNCREVAEAAVAFAGRQTSVSTVIVTHAPMEHFEKQGYRRTYRQDGRTLSSDEALTVGDDNLVRSLLAFGKTVILVKDVPTFPLLPSTCERQERLLGETRCVVPRADLEAARTQYNEAIAEVSRRNPALVVVDPMPVFCTSVACDPRDDGGWLYVDQDHLSVYGSARVLDFVRAELARRSIPIGSSQRVAAGETT